MARKEKKFKNLKKRDTSVSVILNKTIAFYMLDISIARTELYFFVFTCTVKNVQASKYFVTLYLFVYNLKGSI